MDHILTECRNRMNVSTLLFISVNALDVASFQARRFAAMWLKQGHHAAIDPPTGKQKKTAEVHHQSRLFSSDSALYPINHQKKKKNILSTFIVVFHIFC